MKQALYRLLWLTLILSLLMSVGILAQKRNITVEGWEKRLNRLQPPEKIMDAILGGVKIAYEKHKRPFLEVILPDKSESSLGQFIQFKMMEIMYLGALMKVNPFTQPQVDDYKCETRKILADKN